nr:MAG TPA: hypothetical protein [Caudoviricetes sp.]
MSRALLEEAEKTKETLNKRIIDMTVGEFLEVYYDVKSVA